MQRVPPRFFNQGPSAHARLAFFAFLSVALLTVDSRVGALGALRQGIATVLYPLQRTLLMPRDAMSVVGSHFSSVDALRAENAELRRIEAVNAKALLQAENLAVENAKLRELLGARERTSTSSFVAEVLYEARDTYSRRVIIDRGLQHGARSGQPVIDATGVVGQVTRVTPLSSEVTLLTDRSAAIPVEVRRTGQRTIAFGGAESGLLELRFVSIGSDLREGDVLVTSGLDGVYPRSLPVGTITRIEASSSSAAFSRVLVEPAAGLERSRAMLVLQVDREAPPKPADKDENRRSQRAKDKGKPR